MPRLVQAPKEAGALHWEQYEEGLIIKSAHNLDCYEQIQSFGTVEPLNVAHWNRLIKINRSWRLKMNALTGAQEGSEDWWDPNFPPAIDTE